MSQCTIQLTGQSAPAASGGLSVGQGVAQVLGGPAAELPAADFDHALAQVLGRFSAELSPSPGDGSGQPIAPAGPADGSGAQADRIVQALLDLAGQLQAGDIELPPRIDPRNLAQFARIVSMILRHGQAARQADGLNAPPGPPADGGLTIQPEIGLADVGQAPLPAFEPEATEPGDGPTDADSDLPPPEHGPSGLEVATLAALVSMASTPAGPAVEAGPAADTAGPEAPPDRPIEEPVAGGPRLAGAAQPSVVPRELQPSDGQPALPPEPESPVERSLSPRPLETIKPDEPGDVARRTESNRNNVCVSDRGSAMRMGMTAPRLQASAPDRPGRANAAAHPGVGQPGPASAVPEEQGSSRPVAVVGPAGPVAGEVGPMGQPKPSIPAAAARANPGSPGVVDPTGQVGVPEAIAPVRGQQQAGPDPAPVAPDSAGEPRQAATGEDLDSAATAERVMRAVGGQLRGRAGGVVRLRLEPPGLGELRVRMALGQDDLRVTLLPSSESAARLLAGQLHQLRASLESHGLTVAQLQIDPPRADLSGQTGSGGGDRATADYSGGWAGGRQEPSDEPARQFGGQAAGLTAGDDPDAAPEAGDAGGRSVPRPARPTKLLDLVG